MALNVTLSTVVCILWNCFEYTEGVVYLASATNNAQTPVGILHFCGNAVRWWIIYQYIVNKMALK